MQQVELTVQQAADKAHQIIEEIFNLYNTHGQKEYGERVTMLMHMMQAALLAEAEDCNDELIAAAFLHDIGHFFEQEEKMGIYGTMAHDDLGGAYLLEKGFPQRMARLVSSHVAAKRYLTAVDAAYYDTLSEASKQTLTWQGGPMTKEEALEFEKDADYRDYIRIRRWDDQGKDADQPVKEEDLSRMRQLIYTYILSQSLCP